MDSIWVFGIVDTIYHRFFSLDVTSSHTHKLHIRKEIDMDDALRFV